MPTHLTMEPIKVLRPADIGNEFVGVFTNVLKRKKGKQFPVKCQRSFTLIYCRFLSLWKSLTTS